MQKDRTYLDQVISYIKNNLKKGYTKESLKWALINQGHSRMEVDKAFQIVENEMLSKVPELKTKPKITYERIFSDNEIKRIEPKKSFWKKFFG